MSEKLIEEKKRNDLVELIRKEYRIGRVVLSTIEGVLNPDKDTGRPRIWTASDGHQGASYDVNAETVRFLDAKCRNKKGKL